ncbi:hypothetical protein Pcinc_013752 [Petrolisthes cinctipes]|uniref:Uncharacterized protein n=1 Tax=Petrolisthes cinctipes TaxID=88211 RepID=A0AAE1FWE3_PETCI|nr:hypothetical protein Pcinc_013752 [Petrolisthes cinctipes]
MYHRQPYNIYNHEEQEPWISVVVNGMMLETINLVKDHSCTTIMHLYEMYGKCLVEVEAGQELVIVVEVVVEEESGLSDAAAVVQQGQEVLLSQRRVRLMSASVDPSRKNLRCWCHSLTALFIPVLAQKHLIGCWSSLCLSGLGGPADPLTEYFAQDLLL